MTLVTQSMRNAMITPRDCHDATAPFEGGHTLLLCKLLPYYKTGADLWGPEGGQNFLHAIFLTWSRQHFFLKFLFLPPDPSPIKNPGSSPVRGRWLSKAT